MFIDKAFIMSFALSAATVHQIERVSMAALAAGIMQVQGSANSTFLEHSDTGFLKLRGRKPYGLEQLVQNTGNHAKYSHVLVPHVNDLKVKTDSTVKSASASDGNSNSNSFVGPNFSIGSESTAAAKANSGSNLFSNLQGAKSSITTASNLRGAKRSGAEGDNSLQENQ